MSRTARQRPAYADRSGLPGTVSVVNARHALRSAVVLATAQFVLMLSSPAYASAVRFRDDGDEPGPPMPLWEGVLVFVVAPIALFAVIALLVYLPSMMHGPRYRPGLGWWASPVWFGGPAAPEARIATARPTTDGGGASARW